MRFNQQEKMEIIHLVENPELGLSVHYSTWGLIKIPFTSDMQDIMNPWIILHLLMCTTAGMIRYEISEKTQNTGP